MINALKGRNGADLIKFLSWFRKAKKKIKNLDYSRRFAKEIETIQAQEITQVLFPLILFAAFFTPVLTINGKK